MSAFDKLSDTDTTLPYSYTSIMHYHDTGKSKNGGKTLVPKNCEPNCPTKLSNKMNLAALDQQQLSVMYQCKKEQIKHMTDRTECVDWKEMDYGVDVFEMHGEPLSCQKYVDEGKCEDDPEPCCACGKSNSGI
jgi:hypothetical protein